MNVKNNAILFGCLGLIIGVGGTAAMRSDAATTTSPATAANAMIATANNHPPRGERNATPGSFGDVTAVSGNTITMQEKNQSGNTSYTVDASGATITNKGAATTIADVSVGDKIMVKGNVSGTNVAATAISIGFGKGMGHAELGHDGNITVINGNIITMQEEADEGGASYTVDASGATITNKGATASITDLKVGDKIMVKGTVSGNNVAATSISIGCGKGMDRGAHGNFGNITAIDGSIITISEKTKSGDTLYTVDASTVSVKNNGAAASITDLKVGDKIMVEGTVSGNSIAATSISLGQPGRGGFHKGNFGNKHKAQ